ncbi:WXG100 family type VII secretion target [Actinopolyspora saharensis]|uniref:Excreted virulence factor EspC, type VII ESX diderm n=1 Tax=Actinopolyspora saharensis TaxID=995062 RepID=A0A1H1ECV9_9ACTN|nr:hypothetical protein [Actinopolyspora saharensis]SDQ86592.1 hypothetical protein SAMN04489718_2482 [Actinopolyspora saharensis]
MSGFRGDPRRLTEQAGAFGEHAAEAERTAAKLRDALESTRGCWGTDEVGERFADLHLPGAQRALVALDELPARLGELGTKFSETAETYRRVDDAAAERVDGADGGQR